MAGSRYWRAICVEAYDGADLDISELQLYNNGTRIDVGATLTASIAPVSGAVSSLQDGSAAVGVVWDRASVQSAGFALYFDLGAGITADVDAVRAGAGASKSTMISSLVLQSSTDGLTYEGNLQVGRFPWPGAYALNPVPAQSMVLINGETFDSGIPAGYATSLTDSSPLVASYDAASKAVDLDSSSYNTAWMFAPFPAVNGLRMEFDVEFLVPNYGNVPLLGAVFKGGPQLLQNYFAHVGQSIGSVRSNGSDTIGLAETLYVSSGLPSPLPTSGIHTYVMTSQPNGNGTRDYTMTVDGAGVAFSHAHTSSAAMLTGGVFIRSCKARIHAIRLFQVVGGGTLLPMVVKARPEDGMDLPPVQGVDAFGVRSDFADLNVKDMESGGKGRVRGVTLDYVNPLNKPYACRVRLVREIDGAVVRQQWSKADGSYDFRHVDELQSYTVLAYYLDHGKRAVVTDGLTLANGKVELMP